MERTESENLLKAEAKRFYENTVATAAIIPIGRTIQGDVEILAAVGPAKDIRQMLDSRVGCDGSQ